MVTVKFLLLIPYTFEDIDQTIHEIIQFILISSTLLFLLYSYWILLVTIYQKLREKCKNKQKMKIAPIQNIEKKSKNLCPTNNVVNLVDQCFDLVVVDLREKPGNSEILTPDHTQRLHETRDIIPEGNYFIEKDY